jgi:MFS family permease
MTNRPPNDPYAVFRFSNFRFYVFGIFVGEVGEQMIRVAVGYEIFQRTHSPFALGLIGLFIWLPIFFCMLPGGAVADRFDRKTITLVCSGVYALCAAGLALAPHFPNPIPVMYGFLFLIGLTRAFSDPARQALLPQAVPPKLFGAAITWGSNLLQMGSVVGPALGGMLYAWIGYSNVCFTEAFLELVFFFSFLAIRRVKAQEQGEPVSLRALKTGLRFVWKTKLIFATITLDLFVVLFGGATAMLPAYAVEVLKCGSTGLGWLQAAIPIGAFLMSLRVAHHPPKKAGVALLWAVAGFGLVTIVFGLSRWYWLSFLALVLAGGLDLISVIVRRTLVQVLTPDSMRGRVSAVSSIFIHSSNELGGFESGAAAALLGLVPSVVVGGVASVLVVLAVTRLWPELVRLKSFSQK